MVMIYTSIEWENDCIECQIMKNYKIKLLFMADHCNRTTVIISDHI